ncbi:excinuclease ABC subunit UvrC [Umboniibacter marinipuniceus]|uniref:UvrABC system protein C n=1 Tax=Umboniibacter marinipuniceus TaxID=569599 RepID=A0A3M0A9H2_9GAMM|nr:excinuclease ABC subunit UvrC [Umboniibacter marinipuniceus]RMA81177.1 excinuclease ABC subunit C [Umboniibacter marinipuniceus]
MFDAERFLAGLTNQPGVYMMYDSSQKLLYIGKAKNLRKRVSSYFNASPKPLKTMALVRRIADIQVSVVSSETESLLLEQSLIKTHRPPYNILLRDDKSFPFIYLSSHKTFPRLQMLRGKRPKLGKLFGPYTSGLAVRDSLNYLQKALQLRQCDDTFFSNRSRPCLQYQIKRCKAPCVGFISEAEYKQDVDATVAVLEGRSERLTSALAKEMEEHAANFQYEEAAVCRDRISAIRHIQERQGVFNRDGSVDVLAVLYRAGLAIIQQLEVRGGRIVANQSWFPKLGLEETPESLLEQFIAHYYLNDRPDRPAELIVNTEPTNTATLSAAIAESMSRRFSITTKVRGDRAKWLELAGRSAEENIGQRLASKRVFYGKLMALREAIAQPSIDHIECFDISHSSGEATVASCVVFDENGADKKSYRAYNVKDITAGDDYAAMRQALTRRYQSAIEKQRALPDLLIIDGGKGQMKQAIEVLDELAISGVCILGVAKGPTRKAGLETLYLGRDFAEINLMPHDPALHLIQQVRDEAHNHAIKNHRKRRDKKRVVSVLDSIEGIGPAKKQALLRHFGGVAQIERASQQDLTRVGGVSQKLADKIYKHFHPE